MSKIKILVTNDDGIMSDGLWALAGELQKIAPVLVVAPDREQSAIGTAVTLTQPLRVMNAKPLLPGIEAYSVEGTPSDSAIFALEKLARDEIGIVVSGINQGLNVGTDVFISGTVSAALQGHLRGLPAIAISMVPTDAQALNCAARLTARLVQRIQDRQIPADVFLNVNLPELPLSGIKGIKATSLAGQSHTQSVNEGHDGKRKYYWLVHHRVDKEKEHGTDMWSVDEGYVSITSLHPYSYNGHSPEARDSWFHGMLEGLR